MSSVLIRLLIFFPVGLMVCFFSFLLLAGFQLWLMIVLVAAFGLVLSLSANALLGLLLPWHVRCCARADARRAEMYQGW